MPSFHMRATPCASADYPINTGPLCGILIAILRLAPDMKRLTSKALTAALIVSFLLLIVPARPDNDQFPEGPGKATFIKVCSQCHALDPIANAALFQGRVEGSGGRHEGKGSRGYRR